VWIEDEILKIGGKIVSFCKIDPLKDDDLVENVLSLTAFSLSLFLSFSFSLSDSLTHTMVLSFSLSLFLLIKISRCLCLLLVTFLLTSWFFKPLSTWSGFCELVSDIFYWQRLIRVNFMSTKQHFVPSQYSDICPQFSVKMSVVVDINSIVFNVYS
jgi:hypothetical protein